MRQCPTAPLDADALDAYQYTEKNHFMLQIDTLSSVHCHDLMADVIRIIPAFLFIYAPSMLPSVHPRNEFSSTLK